MFEVMEGVERTISILPPYKLASRLWRPQGSVISICSATVGGPQLALIAGPSSA